MSAELIREVQDSLGFTEVELAKELGLSRRTVQRWKSKGADRDVRFMLMGLLVSYGKPYSILWPER